MKRTLFAGACICAAVATLAVVLPTRADAHNAGTYFPRSGIPGLTTRWPFGRMDVYYDPTFPNQQIWRDRVQEAHANWPAATGRPPVFFFFFAPGTWTTGPCVRTDNRNGVFWQPIPGDWLAVTEACEVVGRWYFNMVFDRDTALWPNDSEPSSTAWFDLETIATHEFGHAYGWRGHLPNGGTQICDLSQQRHTMCATIVPGARRQRTPEAHDVHTMDAGYP